MPCASRRHRKTSGCLARPSPLKPANDNDLRSFRIAVTRVRDDLPRFATSA